jgi:hypothetical protein
MGTKSVVGVGLQVCAAFTIGASAQSQGVELEAGQRGEQFQIRQLTAQLEQFRARETEAAQTLTSEQARWVDLNSRLDELDRLLTPAR